jgi:hypothetical protein
MSATATQQPRSRRPVTRGLRRALLPLAAATLAIGLGAGAASADQFSPYVAPQVWRGQFGSCSITVGPVLDPLQTAHGFAAIGGGGMSCGTLRTYQVWTQEFMSTTGVGASYYQRGGTGYFAATGYGFTGILESGRGCGAGYWFTRVTVSVAGYSPLHFDSTPRWTVASGRSGTLC